MTEQHIEVVCLTVSISVLITMFVAAVIGIYRHVTRNRGSAKLRKLFRDWLRLRKQAAAKLARQPEAFLVGVDDREPVSWRRPLRLARSI